ncbi:MAG: LysM peptidoglycan-binding domain-containing protein [Bacteroidetes bacterium]|nr:LysM peptidoglycan-binding domain-containing protein [Bacteroidota bacterium]
MNKLSLLSENTRRIEGMVSQIDKLRKVQPTTQTYTVGTWSRDRDCLWNIAKKKTIYDNPFKWPSLYNANKDKIKDPNLIYPGQILTIPKAN